MVKITWHKGEVPKDLPIRQVYGLICTKEGQFLMRIEEKPKGKVFTLAGGTPEKFDKGIEATLRRELIEEVNTTIEKPYLVGYQEIDMCDGGPKFAQVRMVALIDKIGKKQPDPDNGQTYERILVSPERMIELLNWGDVGKSQVEEAVKIAEEKLGVVFADQEEKYID